MQLLFNYRLNDKRQYLPIVYMSEVRNRIKDLWVNKIRLVLNLNQ